MAAYRTALITGGSSGIDAGLGKALAARHGGCARVIVRGLERGDRVIDFPRPMVAAVRALAAMPDALYEAVASRQKVAR